MKIESLPGEIWKDIPGFEGLYMISNKGRACNIKRGTFVGKNGRFSAKNKNDKVFTLDINCLLPKVFPIEFEDLPNEIWKDIPNTRNAQISNKLRVRFKTQRGKYKNSYKLLNSKKVTYNSGYSTYYIGIPTYDKNGKTKETQLNLFKLAYQIFIDSSINDNFFIELSGDWDIKNLRPMKHAVNKLYKIGSIVFNNYKILDYKKPKGGRQHLSNSQYTIHCLKCNKIFNVVEIYGSKKYFQCDCFHGNVPKEHLRIKKVLYDMKRRCSNTELNDERHKKEYYEKGIFVCKYWQDSNIFLNWWLSIDPNDEHHYTIDRINPDYEYAPYNCQLISHWDNTSKMHFDNNRTPIQIKLDKLRFNRRKKNWLKQMTKLGYKKEDLI